MKNTIKGKLKNYFKSRMILNFEILKQVLNHLKPYKRVLRISFIFMINIFLLLNNWTAVSGRDDKVVRVGFYSGDIQYYIDSNGHRAGYYHDLMELISKVTGLSYEYVDVTIEEAIRKLDNHEIDLLFGVGLTAERQLKYVYSKYYINQDAMAIYTNHSEISFGHLDALNGLNFGYIHNALSFEQFLTTLNLQNIIVNIKSADSSENLAVMLENDEIDFTLASSTDPLYKKFKKIYEISAGPVYIVTTKGNEELMDTINSYFENSSTDRKELEKLYNNYFNDYKKRSELYLVLFVVLLLGIGGFGIYKTIIKLEEGVSRKQLMNKIQNDEFLLYYQPIIDPREKKIMACEALLRLKDRDKILSPFYFLSMIEELDMMEEITLWVLKQVIKDFKEIKGNTDNLDEQFYISMNVSFKELSSDCFIKELKNILENIDLQQIKLCFEIVERYQLEDQTLINDIISELRELGIKIAIDDFGVEYSNLDILDKIDYDVIKLDKHFIDEIQTSYVRKESVLFIGKVIAHNQKRMIMEGMEYPEQLEALNELYSGSVYIQGYLYSPPISLEDIKQFTITDDSE